MHATTPCISCFFNIELILICFPIESPTAFQFFFVCNILAGERTMAVHTNRSFESKYKGIVVSTNNWDFSSLTANHDIFFGNCLYRLEILIELYRDSIGRDT